MENITANRLTAGSVLRFAYLAHLALVFPICLLFGLIGMMGGEEFEEMLLRPLVRRGNDRGQLQRGRGEGGQPGHGTTPMLAAPHLSHKSTCRYVDNHTCRMSIHRAMPIIIRFSVSDRKPNGTLLDPPTQAHFSSRRSI